jgi:hypothetical protein
LLTWKKGVPNTILPDAISKRSPHGRTPPSDYVS